jgi:hypothetical protein
MNKSYFYILFILFSLSTSACFSQDSISAEEKHYENYFSDINILKPDRQVSLSSLIRDTVINDIAVYKNRNTNFKGKRDYLKIGITGGLTLLGTYSAFRFREISNEAYNNYLLTKDEYQHDKSAEYEIYFYVTIALTQAAFAALMYLLFID